MNEKKHDNVRLEAGRVAAICTASVQTTGELLIAAVEGKTGKKERWLGEQQEAAYCRALGALEELRAALLSLTKTLRPEDFAPAAPLN